MNTEYIQMNTNKREQSFLTAQLVDELKVI